MSGQRILGTICIGAMFAAAPAHGAVMLNEILVKGSERVELYNSGAGSVDVNGWTIQGNEGLYVIMGADLIASESYEVIDLPGNILADNGGFIELLDDVGPSSQDGVHYGQLGSAPLPSLLGFLTVNAVAPSLARAPDGSAYTIPPAHSPATDGTIWTLDFSPTFGAGNDAPTPSLGSALLLNEVDPKPLDGLDMVELYNPSPLPVALSGWVLTNGSTNMTLSGVVPGGGHLAITTDAGFDVETHELLYLFDASAVRVDQLGFHLPPVRTAPVLDTCQCYARFADGAGPTLGFDWFTSGGNTTLHVLVCTPGAANVFNADCGTTGVEAPTHDTWGHIKTRWR